MTNVPTAFLDHLDAVTHGPPEALRDVWEPDGVLEFPYARSVGTAERLDGVHEIIGYFEGLGSFTEFAVRDLNAWPTGADEWLAEFHASSTITGTGAPYEQDYIVRFRVSRGGKMEWLREYWDPTRM